MTRKGVQSTEELVMSERPGKASCIKAMPWDMGKKWAYEGRGCFQLRAQQSQGTKVGKHKLFMGNKYSDSNR